MEESSNAKSSSYVCTEEAFKTYATNSPPEDCRTDHIYLVKKTTMRMVKGQSHDQS